MSFNFNQIVSLAIKYRASDIHLTPNKPPFLRIDGKIFPVGQPIKKQETQRLISELLDDYHQAKLEEFRDVDFVYGNAKTKRFRGNAYYTREGIALAFRIIPERIPDFSVLGLPSFVNEFIFKLPKGLVLVTGPTGHGKSTTLASVIKYRADRRQEHYILLEDPIEFIIDSSQSIIHQRSLGKDLHSFERGLLMALREDPDVLMVGEMRDEETISATLTAAETGHVVFSTLHTNSAAESIHRIIDVFPARQQNQVRSQLASTLSMIIAQRLLPGKHGGRVLAYEILTTNYAIKNHIRQNAVYQIPNAMQMDNTGTMVLFEESLARLVLEDKITYETARNATAQVEQLDYILEHSGFDINAALAAEEAGTQNPSPQTSFQLKL